MAKTVYQGGASIDERGKATGGKAGNQKEELRIRKFYVHSKGWVILRAKDAKVRRLIADAMRAAVANRKIGYDQNQRTTLYNYVKQFGFDPSRADIPVETDCSALVRVCVLYAFRKCGIMTDVSNFRTVNQRAALMATGQFVALDTKEYTSNTRGDYLLEGDIAVTKTQGHTVVVLNDGKRASAGAQADKPVLRKGDKGSAVTALQRALMTWSGFALPRYGMDGDFGKETRDWVKKFQKAMGIGVDGIVGPVTWGKLDTI
jgi:hypothetical protein